MRPPAVLLVVALLGVPAACGQGSTAEPQLSAPVSQLIHIGLVQWEMAAGFGAVWVGDYQLGDLVRVDERTGATRRIKIGDPAKVPHTDLLPSAVLVSDGSVWVTKNDAGALLRIDPSSGRIIATVPLGVTPYGLAAGDGSIWVCSWDDPKLVRVDPSTNRVADSFDAVPGSTGLVIAAGAAWIVDRGADSIVRLDLASRKVTAKVQVPPGAGGIVSLDNSIWVASESFGALTQIDPGTASVSRRIQLGPTQQVLGLATDGRYLYAGSVVRVDPGTGATDTLNVPSPFGGGVAYSNGTLWVQGLNGVYRALVSGFRH